MADFSPADLAANNRKARSSKSDFEIPLGDVFVGYRYIELTLGHGFGRTSIWRKIKSGEFPKPTFIGNQNKWRKSVIDAKRDELIPPTSNT